MDKDLGKILIIDDDEDVLLAAKLLLKKHAQQVTIEKNPKKIPFLLNNDTYDVILLDMNFSKDTTSGKEGFYWLSEIIEKDPKAVVILITAFGDVEMAVKALKEGATDFVLKPWQNDKLIATLNTAVKLKRSYNEVDKLRKAKKQLEEDINQPFRDIIGSSPAMQHIYKLVDKVAGTDANVLILGENGTGKELIARAIHQKSLRSDSVYVGVDMGAITETLFESELFGHEAGAFTGARERRIGKFEHANHGTLFLDEIESMPVAVQVRLLRVLQEREVERLGSNQVIDLDIRVVAATKVDLKSAAEKGEFREDLYYRLNVVAIEIPPLRDRREDIPLLFHHFLLVASARYQREAPLPMHDSTQFLLSYDWPGNVRELRNMAERYVLLGENCGYSMERLIHGNEGDTTLTLPQQVDCFEKGLIEQVLSAHGGKINETMDTLGIPRKTLYDKMRKYGLDKRNYK